MKNSTSVRAVQTRGNLMYPDTKGVLISSPPTRWFFVFLVVLSVHHDISALLWRADVPWYGVLPLISKEGGCGAGGCSPACAREYDGHYKNYMQASWPLLGASAKNGKPTKSLSWWPFAAQSPSTTGGDVRDGSKSTSKDGFRNSGATGNGGALQSPNKDGGRQRSRSVKHSEAPVDPNHRKKRKTKRAGGGRHAGTAAYEVETEDESLKWNWRSAGVKQTLQSMPTQPADSDIGRQEHSRARQTQRRLPHEQNPGMRERAVDYGTTVSILPAVADGRANQSQRWTAAASAYSARTQQKEQATDPSLFTDHPLEDQHRSRSFISDNTPAPTSVAYAGPLAAPGAEAENVPYMTYWDHFYTAARYPLCETLWPAAQPGGVDCSYVSSVVSSPRSAKSSLYHSTLSSSSRAALQPSDQTDAAQVHLTSASEYSSAPLYYFYQSPLHPPHDEYSRLPHEGYATPDAILVGAYNQSHLTDADTASPYSSPLTPLNAAVPSFGGQSFIYDSYSPIKATAHYSTYSPNVTTENVGLAPVLYADGTARQNALPQRRSWRQLHTPGDPPKEENVERQHELLWHGNPAPQTQAYGSWKISPDPKGSDMASELAACLASYQKRQSGADGGDAVQDRLSWRLHAGTSSLERHCPTFRFRLLMPRWMYTLLARTPPGPADPVAHVHSRRNTVTEPHAPTAILSGEFHSPSASSSEPHSTRRAHAGGQRSETRPYSQAVRPASTEIAAPSSASHQGPLARPPSDTDSGELQPRSPLRTSAAQSGKGTTLEKATRQDESLPKTAMSTGKTSSSCGAASEHGGRGLAENVASQKLEQVEEAKELAIGKGDVAVNDTLMPRGEPLADDDAIGDAATPDSENTVRHPSDGDGGEAHTKQEHAAPESAQDCRGARLPEGCAVQHEAHVSLLQEELAQQRSKADERRKPAAEERGMGLERGGHPQRDSTPVTEAVDRETRVDRGETAVEHNREPRDQKKLAPRREVGKVPPGGVQGGRKEELQAESNLNKHQRSAVATQDTGGSRPLAVTTRQREPRSLANQSARDDDEFMSEQVRRKEQVPSSAPVQTSETVSPNARAAKERRARQDDTRALDDYRRSGVFVKAGPYTEEGSESSQTEEETAPLKSSAPEKTTNDYRARPQARMRGVEDSADDKKKSAHPQASRPRSVKISPTAEDPLQTIRRGQIRSSETSKASSDMQFSARLTSEQRPTQADYRSPGPSRRPQSPTSYTVRTLEGEPSMTESPLNRQAGTPPSKRDLVDTVRGLDAVVLEKAAHQRLLERMSGRRAREPTYSAYQSKRDLPADLEQAVPQSTSLWRRVADSLSGMLDGYKATRAVLPASHLEDNGTRVKAAGRRDSLPRRRRRR